MDKTTNNVNVSALDILYAKYRKEMYHGAGLLGKLSGILHDVRFYRTHS